MAVSSIPEGYTSITPYLVIKGAAQAIEWYQKAFGAEPVMPPMMMPNGRVMHAETKIGNSHLMLADEFPEFGNLSPLSLRGAGVGLHLYVADTDAVFKKAVEAGATPKMPPTDMFWGDRFGKLTDPFGHEWSIATHIEDVAPDEMGRRAEAAIKQMCAQQDQGQGQGA